MNGFFIDRPYTNSFLGLVIFTFERCKPFHQHSEEVRGLSLLSWCPYFQCNTLALRSAMAWAQNLSSSLILERTSFLLGWERPHWFSMHFVQIFNLFSCFYSPSELPLSHNSKALNSWDFCGSSWLFPAIGGQLLFSSLCHQLPFHPIPFKLPVTWLLSSSCSLSLWIYTLKKNKNNSQYCLSRVVWGRN